MGEKTLQKVEAPLYKRLKTILKELIEKGKIKAGERILSENELISRFNTSVSIKENLIAEKAVKILEEGKNEEIRMEPEIVFRDFCLRGFMKGKKEV